MTIVSSDKDMMQLLLVSLLVAMFLIFEARRYRSFNVSRARCPVTETEVFGPILRGEGVRRNGRWNALLAQDW